MSEIEGSANTQEHYDRNNIDCQIERKEDPFPHEIDFSLIKRKKISNFL